jgi:hypothetical protein
VVKTGAVARAVRIGARFVNGCRQGCLEPLASRNKNRPKVLVIGRQTRRQASELKRSSGSDIGHESFRARIVPFG